MLKRIAAALVVLIVVGASALTTVCPWGAASQARPASDAIRPGGRPSPATTADGPARKAGRTDREPLSQDEILRRVVALTRTELAILRRIGAAEAANDVRMAEELRKRRQDVIDQRLQLYGRAASADATTSSN